MTQQPPSRTLHIYTRVSTVAQADKGTSLQSQLELGTKKAAELGFGHEHWDEGGMSSHHEELTARPVLAALFTAMKSGKVKHLWVYDQSRLSRNDNVASIFRYECSKQGVTLYTKDGKFDLSSPQDSFLKQVLDAVAELDNTTRAERTRLGKIHRVRSGYWHGGPPPFGYQLKNRKLEIEPSEAKWVKKMFSMSASGASPAEIKKELDANGVLARRKGLWTIGSIAAMLKNPHYAGQYTYRDKKSSEVIPVLCPVIVETDVWEAVQTLHRATDSRYQQKNATTKNFYLLRDLLYCAHCGRGISGRLIKSNRESLYYCPNKERSWVKNGGKSNQPWKRGTGCGFERSMNIERTDELVWSLVQDMHAKSSLLKEEVKRRVLDQQGLPHVGDREAKKKALAKVRRLQRELGSVSETIGNVVSRKLLDQLDEISYNTALQRLSVERERIQESLAELKFQLQAETTRRKWIDWIDTFGSEVENTSTYTDEQRKSYVSGIVERIDARWNSDVGEHELTIKFRLPIVADGIRWIDSSKKSRGYELVDGVHTSTVTLSKKAARQKTAG